MIDDYQPATDLLRDKTILVTGAGSGIGRAAAVAFAQYGATLILLGRTVRKLEQVYDEIEQAGFPQAAIYPLNLEGASPKDYADLAQTIAQNFGCLDGLLHNAAILENLTPLANYPIETWYKVIQVNLNAPFMLTQAVLGVLNQADSASVVFTLDDIAEQGNAYWGAYAVAKAGLKTLLQLFANELQANTRIRINGIEPGIVSTNLRLRAYPAADRSQWAEPNDILLPYLYLMGADSNNINKQILRN